MRKLTEEELAEYRTRSTEIRFGDKCYLYLRPSEQENIGIIMNIVMDNGGKLKITQVIERYMKIKNTKHSVHKERGLKYLFMILSMRNTPFRIWEIKKARYITIKKKYLNKVM